MRALQVYLDSSDYSVLSDASQLSAAHIKVAGILLELQSDGIIQIRFSEANVVEAAPKDPSSVEKARERLGMIKKICGQKCLIHPLDIIDLEIKSAINDERVSVGSALNDEGYWFPAFFWDDFLLPSPEQTIIEHISKLDRRKRRELFRDGKVTKAGFDFCRSMFSATKLDLSKKVPISPRSAKQIEMYYSGKVNSQRAQAALLEGFVDLDQIAEWYSSSWDEAAELSTVIREAGTGFSVLIEKLHLECLDLISSLREGGVSEVEIYRTFNDEFKEKIKTASLSLAEDYRVDDRSEPLDLTNQWASLPGITTSMNLVMHVARKSIGAAIPRRPKHSDFPDAYHSLFLPYVDVFRADSFTASVIKECKFPFQTTIVSNFLDLPSQIEAKLKQLN